MPMDRAKYPADWPAISAAIRARAGDRCECTGECDGAHDGGRCGAPNGATIVRNPARPAQWREHAGCSLCLGGDPECRSVRVVLTVAHLDHGTTNHAPENLLALCQRCHLRLDRFQHGANARATRRRGRAVGELPGVKP